MNDICVESLTCKFYHIGGYLYDENNTKYLAELKICCSEPKFSTSGEQSCARFLKCRASQKFDSKEKNKGLHGGKFIMALSDETKCCLGSQYRAPSNSNKTPKNQCLEECRDHKVVINGRVETAKAYLPKCCSPGFAWNKRYCAKLTTCHDDQFSISNTNSNPSKINLGKSLIEDNEGSVCCRESEYRNGKITSHGQCLKECVKQLKFENGNFVEHTEYMHECCKINEALHNMICTEVTMCPNDQYLIKPNSNGYEKSRIGKIFFSNLHGPICCPENQYRMLKIESTAHCIKECKNILI